MPGVLQDPQSPKTEGESPPPENATKEADASSCPVHQSLSSPSPESELNTSAGTCTTSEEESTVTQENGSDSVKHEEVASNPSDHTDSHEDTVSNLSDQPEHQNENENEMEMENGNETTTGNGNGSGKEEGESDQSDQADQADNQSGKDENGSDQSDRSEGVEGEEEGAKEVTDVLLFNVLLMIPGVTQPVNAVVSSRDTVHDLLQFAMERPECCYRTCLSVHYHGKRLDDYFELGSVEDLEEGATLELVEEPYTQRDVRMHVQRLRDLLSTNPLHQSLSNSDGLSLSFLAAITLKDPEEAASRGLENMDRSQADPAPYLTPQAHPHPPPLAPFYPPSLESHFKIPECLKCVSYSPWNPPPSHRRIKGDLLYLDITTLENQELFITACPSGFYLNKSNSQDQFDPTPKKAAHHSRHLVGLLSQVSPLFKKYFAHLQRFGEKKHAFEVLPVPYPVIPWIAPKPEHKPSNFRIDDSVILKGAPDELVLGQLRDWNEELQTARELPTDSTQLTLFRDKMLFKMHCDFIQSATRGAVMVVDGYIPPLNPGDDEKHRMYMWNNIFFSLAFDARNHYQEFGGDNAAHAAAAGDLHGVATYEKVEVKGLYTLGTVLVDYRGFRVVCQTIIPGLLQREQDSAVVYGSIDAGKNISTHDKFRELLKKVGTELHTREHKLLTEKDEVVELPSSLEVKGIIGADNRHYALDMFRVFPPDVNFAGEDEQGRFRHKLAVLRPELVDLFISYHYMMFVKLAREKISGLKVIQDNKKFLEEIRSGTLGKRRKGKKGAAEGKKEKGKGKDEGSGAEEGEEEGEGEPADVVAEGAAPESDGQEQEQSDSTTSEEGEGESESEGEQNETSGTGTGLPSESGMETTPAEPESSEAEAQSQSHSTESESPDQSTEGDTNTTIPDKEDPPITTNPPPTKKPNLSIHGVRVANLAALSALASSLNQPTLVTLSLRERNRGDGEGQTEQGDIALGTGGEFILLQPHRPEKEEEGQTEGEMEEGKEGEKEGGKEGEKEGEKEGGKGEKESEGKQTLDWLIRNPWEIVRCIPEVEQALKDAVQEMGSTNAEDFDLQFNVDILSPGARHADTEEVLKKDRKLVEEAVRYLVEAVIPRMVRDCIQLVTTPSDGQSLSQVMHSHGINMRYLAWLVDLSDKREDLNHLQRLCVREMVARVAKRKLRKLLQDTPLQKVSEAIAHFLNCFLGTPELPKESSEEMFAANGQPRKKQKKKKGAKAPAQADAPHVKLTAEGLWTEIVDEVGWYFRYKLEHSSVTELCTDVGISKLSLLREICKKTGVQMVLREYDFSAKPTFTNDDIASIFPIVKHTDFKSGDLSSVYDYAQSKLNTGNLQLAHKFFMEALQLFVQVYGPMHIDIANCYRQIARIHYVSDEPLAALSYQHKATLLFERLLGVDHPETITGYINLALYCHCTNQTAVGLRLMYRARYLLLLLFGEDHPELATCDNNIGLMLLGLKDHENALKFLENALKVHGKYHGKQSLQISVSHHHIGRVYAFLGDYRAALQHEKAAYTIYHARLGPEHERTKESSTCLKELTEKAVTVQKTINEMAGKVRPIGKVSAITLPGSWGDIAELLSKQKVPHTKIHVVKKRNRKSDKSGQD